MKLAKRQIPFSRSLGEYPCSLKLCGNNRSLHFFGVASVEVTLFSLETRCMENIRMFSREVCEELKYYVYRLVDPRNGQTFYVGKGKNNRVFAHADCVLATYSDVDYNPESDDDDDLKYRTIREIKEAGLDVIYIIQKYGLDEHDALVVESTLIDVYSIDRKLTNKIKGFNSTEPTNAITLQRQLSAEEYQDSPTNPRYMIIKIKEYWLNQRKDLYECVRSAWKVNPMQAMKYPFVLCVFGGIVREVYKVHEWHLCEPHTGRAEFTGEVAEDGVRALFVGKKIPLEYRKKGQASPCLYCKNLKANHLLLENK